ncbi:MAG: amidase domain-containing protein [Tumebacillaceae bacterium]
MYRREWLNTVEAFFRDKNRAWLSGDDELLLRYLAGTPADCHSFHEVRAMREASRERNVRYRKAKTHLQILSANWRPEAEQAVVEAVENVRFYYEQGDALEHESRRIKHRLHLMPFGGSWRLVRDETDREHMPPGTMFGRDEDAFHEEDLADLRSMRGRYDRVRAYKYAELWWNGFNPQFKTMQGNDCTNFISQVVYAGGIPMVGGSSRSSGWWYRGSNWSFSWAVAHSFRLALPRWLHAREVADPRQLMIGDVICYDWDGDGRWQHNTVVTGFDYYGRPLVNAHTVASHRRYWDYRDSYAFTPRTRYSFHHILDQF